MGFDLKLVRDDVADYANKLLDKDGPYGSYRKKIKARCDLYASLDMAITRVIMGEDLKQLPENHRLEWIHYINSFADDFSKDGSYGDTYGHSKLHANGMVIGALGALGGQQKYKCRLYDTFSSVEQIDAWLQKIDWESQWTSSHLFWGGMHCYSFSKQCKDDWKEAVKSWLLAHCDPKTGFWRKGTIYSDRHQALGGLAHILPIFEHHDWAFPFIERTVDSLLKMQLPSGRWFSELNHFPVDYAAFPVNYLDLDALYVLRYAKIIIPEYRVDDIYHACEKYASLFLSFYHQNKAVLYDKHPHWVLAAVSTFGLLQFLLPDKIFDDRAWTDIFSDRRLYLTAEVEKLD